MCRDVASLGSGSGSGLFLMERQMLFRKRTVFLPFFFFWSSQLVMHFYVIDWSFALPDSCPSPTPAPNHCSLLPAVIQVPAGLSLCHWLVTTLMARCTPNHHHHQKTSAGTSFKKCPPTTHLLSILTCMHTFIHPSIHPHQPPTLQP